MEVIMGETINQEGEGMGSNIEIILGQLMGKVDNIEDAVNQKLKSIKELVEQRLDFTDSRIDGVSKKVKSHTVDLDELKDKPMIAKAKLIDDFWGTLKKVAFGAVAAGVVGFFVFLISEYLKG
jgi:hypothetical protein